MKTSLSQIEKSWELEYKGYSVKVERNKRKDCFMSFITNGNNKQYIEKHQPVKNVFLTLKGAKESFINQVKELICQA